MFKKILVPIDLADKEMCQRSVDAATQIAKQNNSKVYLLWVAPHLPSMVSEYLPENFEHQQSEKNAKSLEEIAKNAGTVDYEILISKGNVHHTVLEKLKKHDIDLVIMSSHHPSTSTYLLGSNAAQIVRHAQCSVMVIRD